MKYIYELSALPTGTVPAPEVSRGHADSEQQVRVQLVDAMTRMGVSRAVASARAADAEVSWTDFPDLGITARVLLDA